MLIGQNKVNYFCYTNRDLKDLLDLPVQLAYPVSKVNLVTTAVLAMRDHLVNLEPQERKDKRVTKEVKVQSALLASLDHKDLPVIVVCLACLDLSVLSALVDCVDQL